jgi:hypothetical protein
MATMSAADRGIWFLGAAVLQQSELTTSLANQVAQSASTPSPSPEAPLLPVESLVKLTAECTLSRWAEAFAKAALRPEVVAHTKKYLSDDVPLVVARYLIRPFITDEVAMTRAKVKAELVDPQLAELFVRGGGARAIHAFYDGVKRVKRVIGFWRIRMHFIQRPSTSLETYDKVKLKLDFRYMHWEPRPVRSAVYFPDDGIWVVGISQALIEDVKTQTLDSLPTIGPNQG